MKRIKLLGLLPLALIVSGCDVETKYRYDIKSLSYVLNSGSDEYKHLIRSSYLDFTTNTYTGVYYGVVDFNEDDTAVWDYITQTIHFTNGCADNIKKNINSSKLLSMHDNYEPRRRFFFGIQDCVEEYTPWELLITFDDDSYKKVIGHNTYPNELRDFSAIMYSLSGRVAM